MTTKVDVVSRLVPAALAAMITEHAVPPLIAARAAQLLEPARAIDVVGRLSARYLADVCAAMDPGRISQLIARLPPPQVARVGAELARRREWGVIVGFVSHVSDDALCAAVADLDGEQLLRIGVVLDDLSRLDGIAQLLTDEKLDAILEAAADHGLWNELDGLLASLAPMQAERLAARYASADPDVATALKSAIDPLRRPKR